MPGEQNGRVTLRDLHEVLTQIRADMRDEREELKEWIRELKADADREHARMDADTEALKREVYGADDKPGLRGRVQGLETRTIVAHTIQATLTAIAGYMGMRQ